MLKRFFCLLLVIITLVTFNRVAAMEESNFGKTKEVVLESSTTIAGGVVAALIAMAVSAFPAGTYTTRWNESKLKNLQYIRSPVTRKAEEVVEQLTAIARQYKEETIKQQLDSLHDKIKVLEQDKAKLLEENKKFDQKLVGILLKIQDKFPHKLWEKLVRYYQASCNVIEQGGNYIWTNTFKDRPYLTITVVVLAAGYGIHKKYGKKIKESIQQKLPDSYRVAASKPVDMVSMTYDL